MAEARFARLLRVRQTQRKVALARLADAAASVAETGRRAVLLDGLIADTMPPVQACSGVEFVSRMRFAQRLRAAQVSLSASHAEAEASQGLRSRELQRAEAGVEIAGRMARKAAREREARTLARLVETYCQSRAPLGGERP